MEPDELWLWTVVAALILILSILERYG